MDNFCKVCANLLSFVHEEHKTVKTCRYCSKSYETNALDSLRYQKNKGNDVAMLELEMKTAHKDNVNKKIRCVCPKCKHEFARLFRTKDMQTYVTCIKCRNIELYSDDLFD